MKTGTTILAALSLLAVTTAGCFSSTKDPAPSYTEPLARLTADLGPVFVLGSSTKASPVVQAVRAYAPQVGTVTVLPDGQFNASHLAASKAFLVDGYWYDALPDAGKASFRTKVSGDWDGTNRTLLVFGPGAETILSLRATCTGGGCDGMMAAARLDGTGDGAVWKSWSVAGDSGDVAAVARAIGYGLDFAAGGTGLASR